VEKVQFLISSKSFGRSVFLCQYLHSEALRREIHEGLNVVEQWNSTNGFILYSKGGEFATNQRGEQVLVMLSLHLLQVCLVYINTLMLQRVLEEPIWRQRLLEKDRRALTPLIYSHVNPYGTAIFGGVFALEYWGSSGYL
jgi:TnpA family transposase